jgi:spore maturation protein CgeB
MNFNKILFVGHKKDLNSPDNGLVYYSFYESLKNISKDLKSFFYEDYKNEERDYSLIELHENYKPDIIIYVYQLGKLDSKTLLKLKDSNSVTVNFYGDDAWRFNTFTLKTYHLFDVVVSFGESKKVEYNINRISNVIFSQWAGLSRLKAKKLSKEFDYEISFIGAKTEYREWIIRELKNNGINVVCFGKGWDKGIIHYDEMKRINSRSRISLDLPNSISYDIRYLIKYPIGIYRIIKNYFNKNLKEEDGIKARIFEVTSMGGLLLTYYNSTISNYFKIGEEIYCYNSLNNLVSLIKKF